MQAEKLRPPVSPDRNLRKLLVHGGHFTGAEELRVLLRSGPRLRHGPHRLFQKDFRSS